MNSSVTHRNVSHRAPAASVVCFALAAFWATGLMANSPIDDLMGQWTERGWPLMQQYCLDCHNADYQEAEVDLSVLETLDGVRAHGDLAGHVVNMIRFGAMPPEDADLPDDAQRRDLADQLDSLVYQATCDLRPRPGRTTARRLNRAEYNHAIRDIFGVDLRPADQFPSDEVGGGFDNNADVLSLSPMLMEKYLIAADQVTSAIIVDPATLPNLNKTFAAETLWVIGESKMGSFGQRSIQADGLVWIEVDIPVGGQYTIEVVGSPSDQYEGEVLSTMHDDQGVLKAILEHENRDRGADDRSSTNLTLDAGRHRFFFRTSLLPATKRKELVESDADWKVGQSVWNPIAALPDELIQNSRLQPGTQLKPDRKIDSREFPFRFGRVVVRGPDPLSRSDLPPGQAELITAVAAERDGFFVKTDFPAERCLKPVLRRAFRREINKDDLEPYLDLVETMTSQGASFHRAMQVAVSAVLVSPQFLFRVELPESEFERKLAAKGSAVPRSPTQLASRMSFFLFSSIPDDALLEAARRGELTNKDKRVHHVRRMLKDPKSEAIGTQFARQWFGLGSLQGRDLTEFVNAAPAFDFLREKSQANTEPATVGITPDSLSAETEQLFMHLLRENRPVSELLTSERTFVRPALAKWYGVSDEMVAAAKSSDDDSPNDSSSHSSMSVEVPSSATGRRGILGHAGVLMLTSYPTRNSPVQRGKWILENILGTPPPEAPPGVPGLEETQTASADATLREQLELHRADPGCASCHRVMDSLGFGLEEFDHLGRLRDESDPARADATGQLPGGRQFSGTTQLAELLAKTEARKLAETAVRRMMAFAIGRELTPSDRCFVEVILDATAADGYRVGDLLEQVIESPPFLNHEAELPENVDSVADHQRSPVH